ncbi:hypothetical protein JVU11DRAFT_1509 [Chiua virens]|nr:hypothetical protein JVU11DRAFT_1509 [Chiua virens]
MSRDSDAMTTSISHTRNLQLNITLQLQMADIIDLTVSPGPEIIEISSDPEHTCYNRTHENKKRKKTKGKQYSDLPADATWILTRPSRAHSQEIIPRLSGPDASAPRPLQTPPSASDEPGLFFFDDAPAPITVDDPPSPQPVKSNSDGTKLLLPSHVEVFYNDGPVAVEVIPPPKLDSDDDEYIEYLDYEDRKAPGMARYFEVEGEESNNSKPSIFKCKNCGAEGDHKTYDCPIQICLTCGARDEHSTRSCPISKTCYTCGMKGHINKTCPNRFSAHMAPSDSHSDCERCGSTEHKRNECPTLWRIYRYVTDDERIMILQSREEKKPFAIGEGGERYIGLEVWCYNCANTGHLGDDCDELSHPSKFPTEYSAFSSHSVMSGPFYDPATEPVSIKRGPRQVDGPPLPDNWDGGAPVSDVGKRGKNKDKERLEKRFREQEDEAEDWFNDMRNVKRRGVVQQTQPQGARGKIKFGSFRDGGCEHSSPTSSLQTNGGSSLLARLSDTPGKFGGKSDRGYDRHEPSYHSENSLRIRGAAFDYRHQDGKYANLRKADHKRGQDRSERVEPGNRGSRRGHGPRYRGGYDR